MDQFISPCDRFLELPNQKYLKMSPIQTYPRQVYQEQHTDLPGLTLFTQVIHFVWFPNPVNV